MVSLEQQTVEELGGRWSILHRQKRDHAKLDRMLDQLPSRAGEERDELLDRICRLVFSHAFAKRLCSGRRCGAVSLTVKS